MEDNNNIVPKEEFNPIPNLNSTDGVEKVKKKKKKKKSQNETNSAPATEQTGGLSNLQLRLISGVLGGTFIVGGIWYNQWTFFALFFGITLLSMIEFYGLIKTDNKKPNVIPGIIIGMSIYTLTFLIQAGVLSSKLYFALPPIICLLFIEELYINKKKPFTNVAFTILGILYVAIPFSLLVVAAFSNSALMGCHFGAPTYSFQIVLGSLYLLWASDSGAYFSGKAFGRTKLFERISPKKTWEGTIGGAVLSLTVAYILSLFYTDLPLWKWVVVSLLIVVFGSFGDLVESSFKRSLKLKDSGSLIPGHGGFLDRFDGLLLAAPFIAAFLVLSAC